MKPRLSEDTGFGFTISRADVAECMIKTVADRASVGKVLGVSIDIDPIADLRPTHVSLSNIVFPFV